MYKDGHYELRNNAQDKTLGKMTEINTKVSLSQDWPGPEDSTEVTFAIEKYMSHIL